MSLSIKHYGVRSLWCYHLNYNCPWLGYTQNSTSCCWVCKLENWKLSIPSTIISLCQSMLEITVLVYLGYAIDIIAPWLCLYECISAQALDGSCMVMRVCISRSTWRNVLGYKLAESCTQSSIRLHLKLQNVQFSILLLVVSFLFTPRCTNRSVCDGRRLLRFRTRSWRQSLAAKRWRLLSSRQSAGVLPVFWRESQNYLRKCAKISHAEITHGIYM